MLVVVVLLVLGLFAVLAIITTPHYESSTGRLSRTARRRDREAVAEPPALQAKASTSEREEPATPPQGALLPRHAEPAPSEAALPARRAPGDETLGVTRRQFFNRSILLGIGLGVTTFGASTLAFLWPTATKSGFGEKIQVGSVADVQAAIAKKQPFYNATARAYLTPYPKADLAKAKKVTAYTPPIIAGMELGYVALYQKCPHLGCRVPWCDTSQWFECPCHGSKYNRVGEKVGGPAPRGMDRFPFTISGGTFTVDTGSVVLGPPIGTNTTDQAPEGPLCV
jgi:cytochrome b6-f complex iron-sulfur subunit